MIIHDMWNARFGRFIAPSTLKINNSNLCCSRFKDGLATPHLTPIPESNMLAKATNSVQSNDEHFVRS